MQTVSLSYAKIHLSGLVEQIASGAETEITIVRHGQPVARLAPAPRTDAAQRIGVAAGQFEVPDDIDAHNQDILDMMSGT